MKIYTEVNYKWLDGQLVKTDSKSFEYEGKLSLCSMGGGGGGGDPITEAVTTVVDTGTGAIEDAGDIASDTLGDFGEGLQEGVESFGDKIIDDDLEHAINVNVDKLHDYGKAVNTVVADELTRWSDFAMEKGKEISALFPGLDGGGDTVTDPDRLKAVKGGLKKKSRANLKVNKSLGRARSSLRIG